jgi:hypothetical protein
MLSFVYVTNELASQAVQAMQLAYHGPMARPLMKALQMGREEEVSPLNAILYDMAISRRYMSPRTHGIV